jgi:alkanesulfonate monooxygenase SsuD/methylene tetrahydromethanopterin reductase-like flavin-dependent oxidoreductase (luciferase family)
MKFWQMLTWMEPEQILEVARFAEEVGFEGVMLGDHGVFPLEVKATYPYSADGKPPMAADAWYPDCWATIGAISAVTRRIRFAVAVYVLPLRNVFEVARATGTLAILSNNRFILEIGRAHV